MNGCCLNLHPFERLPIISTPRAYSSSIPRRFPAPFFLAKRSYNVGLLALVIRI
ncbi:hypothetical protein K449DRAFT_392663 [Hypoxylon sp. EC38]|nr:hypothetical protein K449DRAFT_392663 [Hypoxylon sp. EC38]